LRLPLLLLLRRLLALLLVLLLLVWQRRRSPWRPVLQAQAAVRLRLPHDVAPRHLVPVFHAFQLAQQALVLVAAVRCRVQGQRSRQKSGWRAGEGRKAE
jgi:hypothetical protein